MSKKAALLFAVALLGCAASVAVALSLGAPEDVNSETTILLEKVKSRDPAVRENAVVLLVGIREAVSQELSKVVSDANANTAGSNPAAKASALYLIGEWALVQCQDVLQAEKAWGYGGEMPTDVGGAILVGSMRDKLGIPARRSLGRTRLSVGATLQSAREKADLSVCPALKNALLNLRSKDNAVFQDAEDKIYWWYRNVREGLESILLADGSRLYSDDVRISAAFLAGEYRIPNERALLKNIDLKDEKLLTAKYPSSVSVDATDASYPAAVAIVKCGHRLSMEELVRKMGDKACSDGGRERIAHAMMAIDPKVAKEEFDRYYDDVAGLQFVRNLGDCRVPFPGTDAVRYDLNRFPRYA